MTTIFRLLPFLFLALNTYAQDADSIAFSQLKWKAKKIAKSTKVYTAHATDSNLFISNQYLSFIEVVPSKNTLGFFIGYDSKKLIRTSEFGKQNNAIAAINGTFFDMRNGGSVDFIKVNDSVIHQNRLTDNKRARHQKAAIVINNQQLAIKKWDGTPDWENNLAEESVMLSGPLLMMDNYLEKLNTASFNTTRHPRSAIGIKPNGNVLLLTIDGRNANSAGMSLFELAKVMKWLGCTSAINLDGGGSTTLWAKKYGNNGIINHPSDNRKWDHNGERRVANVIFIKSKDKQ